MSTPETWAEAVEAWAASGQPTAEYCADRGLRVGGLRYWAGRIRRERGDAVNRALTQTDTAAGTPTVDFGRVRVVRSRRSASGLPTAPPQAVVTVIVGDVEIHVGADVEAGTLREVLSAVRGSRGGRS